MTLVDLVALVLVLPVVVPVALVAWFFSRWRPRLGTVSGGRLALRFERR